MTNAVGTITAGLDPNVFTFPTDPVDWTWAPTATTYQAASFGGTVPGWVERVDV